MVIWIHLSSSWFLASQPLILFLNFHIFAILPWFQDVRGNLNLNLGSASYNSCDCVPVRVAMYLSVKRGDSYDSSVNFKSI